MRAVIYLENGDHAGMLWVNQVWLPAQRREVHVRYVNPRYFDGELPPAGQILVRPTYTAIVEACLTRGVPMSVIGADEEPPGAPADPPGASGWRLERIGVGWYDVYDPQGVRQNTRRLRKPEAEAVLARAEAAL